MEQMWIDANRTSWDARAAVHAASPDYEVDRLAGDREFLSGVVRFDRERLGDISGLTGVHLQCHIGTDTVSLARLGAAMTGLDLSPESLAQARLIADRCGADVEFVQANTYDAVDALGGRTFDLVYTGIGALCWLPGIARWASVVARLLAPGGRLFVRDTHPMLYTLDDTTGADDPIRLTYSYFEQEQPLAWTGADTYVETDEALPVTTSYEWNHGVGEIVTALLAEGLTLTGLTEHDSVPWNALVGHMTPDELGEYRLTEKPERLAASFTICARKEQATRVS